MVSAWFMDSSDVDQREEHKYQPNRPVDLEELSAKTGILYFKIAVNPDGSYDVAALEKIKKERGYSYQDDIEIVSERSRGREFIQTDEHLHGNEEIRLCLKGSGYYDVREPGQDVWIRVHMVPGDMFIVPAGCYHRFTLDTTKYMRVVRLFVGSPVWTPFYRPADEQPARIEYCRKFLSGS